MRLLFKNKKILILLGLIVLFVISAYILLTPYLFFSAQNQRGISVEKVNSLVPYNFCLPTYLPPLVNPNQIITYDSFFGDASDTTVWIDYKDATDENIILKVFYVYNPNAENAKSNTISNRENAHFWLAHWGAELYKVNDIKEIKIKDSRFEDRYLYLRSVIVEPSGFHTVLIEWDNGQVHYRLYTILSIDEAQKIASSITIDCKQ